MDLILGSAIQSPFLIKHFIVCAHGRQLLFQNDRAFVAADLIAYNYWKNLPNASDL